MSDVFRTLSDLDVSGKTVLVRGDLNVPMTDGRVTDTTRLQRLLKTIRELKTKNARIVILSHFGRPKGKPDSTTSLIKVVPELEKLLGEQVVFCPESIGARAKAAIQSLPLSGVIVLENTRYHKGEEEDDPALAAAFAALGDIYVNDAFSVAHRAHVSTHGLARLLPSCAGRDMENEVEALSNALDHPQRPLVAIVGGSKISTKLDLLKNLTAKVDVLVPGGGMANTFLAAGGVKVGASLCEYDMLDTAKEIMAGSIKQGCQIILPQDVAIAPHFATQAAREIVDVTAIPGKMMALDVGPKSVAAINDVLETAKTIVWNGPLGAFELSPFEQGTKAVAQTIARLTADGKVLSVAGGGDTVAAVNMAGVASNLTYVSTAGGAFLEWLEGRVLPGVEILRKEKTPSKVVM